VNSENAGIAVARTDDFADIPIRTILAYEDVEEGPVETEECALARSIHLHHFEFVILVHVP
jgi:hypothetical protein